MLVRAAAKPLLRKTLQIHSDNLDPAWIYGMGLIPEK